MTLRTPDREFVRLRKPPYPDPVGTATYFWVHAGHRETAIDAAVAAIRQTAQQELVAQPEGADWGTSADEMWDWAGEWVVETLLQGAWMREYHEWEKATKTYFDGNHARNGGAKVDWRGKLPGASGTSHVDRVRAQLAVFGATVPADTLDVIDRTREHVNLAKHEAEHFIGEVDYRALVQAVTAFWKALTEQEEFTPPIQ